MTNPSKRAENQGLTLAVTKNSGIKIGEDIDVYFPRAKGKQLVVFDIKDSLPFTTELYGRCRYSIGGEVVLTFKFVAGKRKVKIIAPESMTISRYGKEPERKTRSVPANA